MLNVTSCSEMAYECCEIWCVLYWFGQWMLIYFIFSFVLHSTMPPRLRLNTRPRRLFWTRLCPHLQALRRHRQVWLCLLPQAFPYLWVSILCYDHIVASNVINPQLNTCCIFRNEWMLVYRKLTRPGSCVLSCTCFCVEFGIRLKELLLKYPHSYRLERFPCEIIRELLFLSSWQIRPFRDMAVPATLVHKCHCVKCCTGTFLIIRNSTHK